MKTITFLFLGLGVSRVAGVFNCKPGQACAIPADCENPGPITCGNAGLSFPCGPLEIDPNTLGCGSNPGPQVSETPPVCCGPITTGGNDPWITGINGQKFLFDGADGKWYSLIHDPSRLNLNMRIYSPLESDPSTFFNGAGITVYDGQVEHRISLTTKDTKNFLPKCPEGRICIANGALEVEIDGVKVTEPGFHAIGEEIDFAIVNAPWDCKNIPKAHQEWDKVQLAMEKKMEKNGRRLTVFDPMAHVLESFKHQHVFEAEKCAAWLQEREQKGDVFSVNGEHATMFLTLEEFAIQLEFTMNTDPRWIDHQRFDVVVSGLIVKDKDAMSGILGETAVVKYDNILKTPVMEGREDVLSGPDSDYEVNGPFGTEFKARKHSDLRKLF